MRSNQGFTLTEIIVAMVLLATLGGLGMLSLAGSRRVASGQEGQCYNWGRNIMEQMYDDITADNWPLASRVLSPASGGWLSPSNQNMGGTVNICERYRVESVNVGGNVDAYRRLRMVVDDSNCGTAMPF